MVNLFTQKNLNLNINLVAERVQDDGGCGINNQQFSNLTLTVPIGDPSAAIAPRLLPSACHTSDGGSSTLLW
ncbi:hypothetical protein L1987_01310 [Smallanthus sonchifolius]|uniref:Uncharacterized protein n=2 Tax=Smallanthus sonchifolius TaxID=185202 RepID=A0ACB9K4Q4_9ASTR|nr:hypothetical protein L1987_01306 [Smallanthus sonchifolius]KAI3827238.1 hypothetical protein L1987_01310 [Smallanthus sonchifolius]